MSISPSPPPGVNNAAGVNDGKIPLPLVQELLPQEPVALDQAGRVQKKHPYLLYQDFLPGGAKPFNVPKAQAEDEAKKAFLGFAQKIDTNQEVTLKEVIDISNKLARAGHEALALKLGRMVIEDIHSMPTQFPIQTTLTIHGYKATTQLVVREAAKALQ